MRRIQLFSSFVVLALLLLACSRAEPSPPNGTPSPTEVTPQLDPTPLSNAQNTVVAVATPTRGIFPRPTVDSGLSVLNRTDRPVVGGLAHPDEVAWSTLASPDPLAYLLAGTLHRTLLDLLSGEPALSQSWTMQGNRVTFTLRESATWSDRTPLQAADVADILLQAVEAGELVGLESARALDRQRLELNLSSPSCASLMRAATWPIVDVLSWPPVRTSGGATVSQEGSDAWLIEPANFIYRTFPDELALREAWEQGEINSIVGASRLTMGSLSGEQRAAEQSGPLLATLLFRMGDPLAGDITVRQALTLATDRVALFESAYGFAPPALLSALLPSGHWAAPQALPDVDIAEARRLLASAEWRDRDGDGVVENALGQPLSVTLSIPLTHDSRWERLAQELAEQWNEIGVAVSPLYLESFPLRERLHDGRWQVALVAYTVSADPDQTAMWSTPAPNDLVGLDLNVTGYRNSAVSDLFQAGAELPGCDLEERAVLYEQAWEQLLEERPLWPLFALPLDEVHRPAVVWSMRGN